MKWLPCLFTMTSGRLGLFGNRCRYPLTLAYSRPPCPRRLRLCTLYLPGYFYITILLMWRDLFVAQYWPIESKQCCTISTARFPVCVTVIICQFVAVDNYPVFVFCYKLFWYMLWLLTYNFWKPTHHIILKVFTSFAKYSMRSTSLKDAINFGVYFIIGISRINPRKMLSLWFFDYHLDPLATIWGLTGDVGFIMESSLQDHKN